MKIENLKATFAIWLYAVALLFSIQIGALVGMMLSLKQQVTYEFCASSNARLSELTDRLEAIEVSYRLLKRESSTCSGTDIQLETTMTGPVWKLLAQSDRVDSSLTKTEFSFRKAVRFDPDPSVGGFFGFAVAAAIGLTFLTFQRRTRTFIDAPETLLAPVPIACYTVGAVVALVMLLWVPFYWFLPYMDLPNYLFIDTSKARPGLALWLYMGLLAPLTEEIIFRAWLLEAWERIWGRWIALPVSALCFSLVHPMDPLANVLYLVPGVVLGYLWLKTRSLMACTTAHATYNILAVGAVWWF